MTSEALRINLCPDCSRVTNPDMAHSYSSEPTNTVALAGSACHSGLHGSSISTALTHQEDYRWRLISRASMWTSVTTQAIDSSTDSGCERAMDPDMVVGNSPVLMSLWPYGYCRSQYLQVPVAVWPPNTKMSIGGNSDPHHPLSLW